jgi:hypothetical protein
MKNRRTFAIRLLLSPIALLARDDNRFKAFRFELKQYYPAADVTGPQISAPPTSDSQFAKRGR